MPKVSILMPAYNAEKFLDLSVNGILKQTFKDFELVIINDGSKDNTSNILKKFKDSRIHIYHQENMGVSRTLNKGIKLAKGTYIRRHDADDFSEPDMLEKQVEFLEQHPEIALVSTQCAFMTENGKVSFKYRQPKNNIFKKNQSYVLATYEDFTPFCPIVHGTVLCKKSIFEEFNGYRTEFLTSEDNDLWLRILDKYPIAILNQVSYYLRLSSSSATKIHKSSTRHYRNLALKFSEERREKGKDSLMLTGKMPEVEHDVISITNKRLFKGKTYRNDIVNFQYLVNLDARDWKGAYRDISLTLKSGWLLPETYKAIFFPLFGDTLVKLGVKIKQMLLPKKYTK